MGKALATEEVTRVIVRGDEIPAGGRKDGEVSANADSDVRSNRGNSRVAVTWAQHAESGDVRWHAIASITTGQSVITYCRGRWPVSDKADICNAPSHDARCEECSRQLIEDVRRVERGLAELASFDDDWQRWYFEDGELGGEGG